METQINQRRGLLILLFFTFFMVVGFDMIMPLVIGHYVNNVGLTATAVSVALAIRQFSQQGLAMIGGALADRFQVKTLISVGVFLRVLGFLTLAFSSAYGMLIAAMILIGLGGVLFEMPYQSAIAMLTTNDNRPKYYSLNNTITGIASAIGPLLGVALLRLDFKVVCFGAASCFMINFVLSRVAMPPIMRQAKSYAVMPAVKRIAKDRPYQIFVLLMMVFWLGASQIDITYPLRVQEIYGSADGVGIMYTVYAVVMAVLQYPLVALASKRFSSRAAVVIGTAGNHHGGIDCSPVRRRCKVVYGNCGLLRSGHDTGEAEPAEYRCINGRYTSVGNVFRGEFYSFCDWQRFWNDYWRRVL